MTLEAHIESFHRAPRPPLRSLRDAPPAAAGLRQSSPYLCAFVNALPAARPTAAPGRRAPEILKDVQFTLEPGAFVAMLGQSGSGAAQAPAARRRTHVSSSPLPLLSLLLPPPGRGAPLSPLRRPGRPRLAPALIGRVSARRRPSEPAAASAAAFLSHLTGHPHASPRAGKTTLLNILTGKASGQFSGSLRLNGRRLRYSDLRRVSKLVPQQARAVIISRPPHAPHATARRPQARLCLAPGHASSTLRLRVGPPAHPRPSHAVNDSELLSLPSSLPPPFRRTSCTTPSP